MINLYDILDAADGQLFGEPVAQIFTGFSVDPRQVKSGEIFVALKTEHGDGHHFMQEAIQAGAVGLMCTHPPSFDTEGVTVIIMRDVEAALMRWTRYILNKYDTTVIAVTGTHGKSTACRAVAQVLSTRYEVYYEQSELMGRFGIPLALGHLQSHHQLVVLEFHPTQPGDMIEMVTATEPTVAVITGISGESDMLLREVETLIGRLPDDGLAILNYDQPAFGRLRTAARTPCLTLSVDTGGTSFGADLTAYNLVTALDKTGFDVRYGSARHVGKWVPLIGSHQLYVVLAAVGVGLAFEVPFDDAFSALTHLEPLPGRMRPLPGISGCLLIDDTASGSAHSLLMALNWLRAIIPRADIRETQLGQLSPFGKVYVVIGELDDLDTRDGVDSFTLGERIADVATVLITEGDSLAQVTRTALDSGMPPGRAHMTYSHADSAAAVQEEVGDKDVVLISGNNNARMERVVSDLLADAADARILVRQTRTVDVDWEVPGLQPTWIQVDINVIARNVRLLKEMLPDSTRLMAIVKANAYGHGAVPVSTTAALNGADYLGVAKPEEALLLRDAGVTAPLLILSHTPPQMAAQIVENDLTVTLYDQTVARAMNRAAANMGKTLLVHVRVDMGSGGMGVPFADVAVFFRALARLNNIHVEGIYTSLSTTDWNVTQKQLASFRETVKMLRAADVAFDFAHAAGSAVMLHMEDSYMDMVRCGMAIYGLSPHPDVTLPEGFQPALTWKTTIVQVKRVRMADDDVGLPGTSRTRTIAVLPVGYTDGVRSGWQHVLVNGQPAPVIEPVEAYQMLVDVSGIDDVRAGDEAVLIGVQGSQQIEVKTIAEANGVRSDEILSSIHVSVIRVK